jgi:hypothetical protein
MNKPSQRKILSRTMATVQFMSAEDKRAVLKDWARFLQRISPGRFSDRLYQHLYRRCSFASYITRDEFYGFYFTRPGMAAKFFNQFFTGNSAEFGHRYWAVGATNEYADVNSAMMDLAKLYREDIERQLAKIIAPKSPALSHSQAHASA